MMILKNIEKAPEEGMLYGVYTDEIRYKKYVREQIGQDMPDNLLELHLFDYDREYRFISTNSGTAEWLISDKEWKLLSATGRFENVQAEENKDWEIYEESVYVTPDDPDRSDGFKEKDKITVVNYIEYDENDMIRVKNYRYSTKGVEV